MILVGNGLSPSVQGLTGTFLLFASLQSILSFSLYNIIFWILERKLFTTLGSKSYTYDVQGSPFWMCFPFICEASSPFSRRVLLNTASVMISNNPFLLLEQTISHFTKWGFHANIPQKRSLKEIRLSLFSMVNMGMIWINKLVAMFFCLKHIAFSTWLTFSGTSLWPCLKLSWT